MQLTKITERTVLKKYLRGRHFVMLKYGKKRLGTTVGKDVIECLVKLWHPCFQMILTLLILLDY